MSGKRKLAISRARALRKSETDPESLIWRELRGRREDGLKFRRQHPVPPYILDFAERTLKLAIEIDGATHSTDAEKAYDTARTAFLSSKGWTVIRFTNSDVFEDIDEMLEAV
ncbi:endonuclease domain-containing protein [Hellea balneolensis]|uniref:endonuclease domain-containing protein n=1 Tax=Hellea balneolensis TaxID=287478 RepID=UPI0003FE85DB|nr:DUF559 domain-containing protein [Hellea balneolensis]